MNAAATKGRVAVEVLDEGGSLLVGYSRKGTQWMCLLSLVLGILEDWILETALDSSDDFLWISLDSLIRLGMMEPLFHSMFAL